jgi:hypothetical protein
MTGWTSCARGACGWKNLAKDSQDQCNMFPKQLCWPGLCRMAAFMVHAMHPYGSMYNRQTSADIVMLTASAPQLTAVRPSLLRLPATTHPSTAACQCQCLPSTAVMDALRQLLLPQLRLSAPWLRLAAPSLPDCQPLRDPWQQGWALPAALPSQRLLLLLLLLLVGAAVRSVCVLVVPAAGRSASRTPGPVARWAGNT